MMTGNQSDSDLFAQGISTWAARVRSGKLSFHQSMEICLQRCHDAAYLGAFECLDTPGALATASAMDGLLAQGVDLGPLMGLPLGVKDIMVANGFPTTNGSNADTTDLNGPQGSVVSRLREKGCIPLGKTRTVEFALGASGVNESRGTPWNPADRLTQRIPGGSSSGSAVACSAALVGLALGSDTGGSIRNPACLTGIVGHKSSVGLWPTDGVFSLSSTLDSIGPLCRKVDDASLLHEIMTGERVDTHYDLSTLRLGIVEDLFFDDLDDQVAEDFEQACQQLEQHGARRVALRFPEVHERSSLFASIVPAELIANLTPERFEAIRNAMDSVTESRAAVGLETSAWEYVQAQRRRAHLVRRARETFADVDVWICPTCPFVAMPVAQLQTPEGHQRALLASRNTQPGNLLDMCGLTIPMQRSGLPTGLQITRPLNQDAQLLSIGRAIEAALST